MKLVIRLVLTPFFAGGALLAAVVLWASEHDTSFREAILVSAQVVIDFARGDL